MTEMIFRIPSRTVQYGYIEFKVNDPNAATSPELMAAMYVSYVYAFQKEEEATIERLAKGVSASQEAAPGNPQAAADRLAGGRKPRTVDEANEMAKQVIENELGSTTEVPEDAAPWDKPAVDAKPKPWETKPKPVVDDTW